jgi:lipopolysaccharide/colanic/teichoic acid biosynthesis glycosyltransferase
MYKIRSMYPDAEARKAALYAESSHADGMMFKMDFDPRVIGNRILPDGTRKKGIGAFIRDTSLDEFPQFFNVLKGDMSLVGTRPPTPDEWEKYQYRHRARMSVRPGLTGLWQISPDKDTMSFDEVVRLDTEYISNWGLGTDLRILLATAEKLLRGILGLKEKENEKETSESGAAR